MHHGLSRTTPRCGADGRRAFVGSEACVRFGVCECARTRIVSAVNGPLEDVVAEAVRIADAAREQGALVRVIGGVAVRLHCPSMPPQLQRIYGDIDLATPTGMTRQTETLMADLGYVADEQFNAVHGQRRLIVDDPVQRRRIDIFVGEFELCHAIPITERLALDPLTIPLAELLLTKLQVVQANFKDLQDMWALLLEHPVGDRDDETINGAFIARLLADNWGLWRTATGTIGKLRARLEADSGLDAEQRRAISQRLDELTARIDGERKSLRWRTRAKVGERVRWYAEPEEIE
jgi:hypothetical protein